MHLTPLIMYTIIISVFPIHGMDAADAANNMRRLAEVKMEDRSEIEVEDPPCPGLDYPAVLSLYDPELGGRNCDMDCSTVATGVLNPWMYNVAGACPVKFLGGTVHFPDVGHSLQCVDTGPTITSAWSDRDQQCVVYFDTLWHLQDENGDGRVDRNEDGSISGLPFWFMWFQEDWFVTWD